MESKGGIGNLSNSLFRDVTGWVGKKAAKQGVHSESSTVADPGVDILVLAADVVEKIAKVADKAPLIAPVAALVSEVFKTVKEVQDVRGTRNKLHTELEDRKSGHSGHSGAPWEESSYGHGADERLEQDLETYRGLLKDASKLVSDFDAQGSWKTTMQYFAWKRKFDNLEKQLHAFQDRFIVSFLR
ncbi:hypothetical protein DFH07DRAFT_18701 [Mycena maculata]|uniref:Uncharacterized protein n=1 Tax=Mycena maculata TaxID=230809 RepID=A0AAD7IMC2_9AGAR|nr:hypothetical protein DFH07DRAFT_18701 [Mycena maculata]